MKTTHERKGIVTMMGTPLTLIGHEVNVGDPAPDFVAIDNNLAPFTFSSLLDNIVIISSVPSLDTPVCNLETQRFNEEAIKLGSDIHILTVSMDLPFAQKRWCGDHGVTSVKTVSDHRDASFGLSYGVLIKETRLLARAVFVVDKRGDIKHIEIVDDLSHEPKYEVVLETARRLGR